MLLLKGVAIAPAHQELVIPLDGAQPSTGKNGRRWYDGEWRDKDQRAQPSATPPPPVTHETEDKQGDGDEGRRYYLSAEMVLAKMVASGQRRFTRDSVAKLTGLKPKATQSSLYRLEESGKITKIELGCWVISEELKPSMFDLPAAVLAPGGPVTVLTPAPKPVEPRKPSQEEELATKLDALDQPFTLKEAEKATGMTYARAYALVTRMVARGTAFKLRSRYRGQSRAEGDLFTTSKQVAEDDAKPMNAPEVPEPEALSRPFEPSNQSARPLNLSGGGSGSEMTRQQRLDKLMRDLTNAEKDGLDTVCEFLRGRINLLNEEMAKGMS